MTELNQNLFAVHPGSAQTPEMSQMFGVTLQWAQSSYVPYSGFHAANGAVGEYNSKFMANQYVLRDSACLTPENHARASHTNLFQTFACSVFGNLSGVRRFTQRRGRLIFLRKE